SPSGQPGQAVAVAVWLTLQPGEVEPVLARIDGEAEAFQAATPANHGRPRPFFRDEPGCFKFQGFAFHCWEPDRKSAVALLPSEILDQGSTISWWSNASLNPSSRHLARTVPRSGSAATN